MSAYLLWAVLVIVIFMLALLVLNSKLKPNKKNQNKK